MGAVPVAKLRMTTQNGISTLWKFKEPEEALAALCAS
jgi:hypothetical protein